MKYRLEPADRRFVASVIDETRAALGSAAFERATAFGRTLDLGAVMSDLRTWLQALASSTEAGRPQQRSESG